MMFSYRHAFHAGNHADVLKHLVLIAVLKHLTLKDTALNVFDTHAGAGLYKLNGDYAKTSGEANQGVLKFFQNKEPSTHQSTKTTSAKDLEEYSPALQDYLDILVSFNVKGGNEIYPGSPFIIQKLLEGRDKLKLFEIHPTDSKTLVANIAQLKAGRQVTVLREDGFEGLKKFLPPPSKRALILCDPSYEMKSDYPRVCKMIADALERFATGTYMIWYPIIPRPEAHDIPKKLKTLATRTNRPWLNVSLTVKSSKLGMDEQGEVVRPGLPASGLFVINPPHTLKATLQLSLPELARKLGQDQHASFNLDSAG